MKKTIPAVLFLTAMILTACSANVDFSLDDNKQQPETQQSETKPSETQTNKIATPENSSVVETDVSSVKTGEKQNHPGVIKSLPSGKIHGDFAYVLESTDSKQTDITYCDKRVEGVWNNVLLVADKNVNVDIYGTDKNGGLCINGIVVDTGVTNASLNGTIEALPKEKVYGDFAYVLVSSDETQTGLTMCDKRTEGIWNEVLSMAGTNNPVYIFGSEKTGGVCVNGIIVK